MAKKPIIASAVLIAILLLVLILFITARPPAITVRHIKSIKSDNRVTAIFEFTNLTTSSCVLVPNSVEVRTASLWKTCFHFLDKTNPITVIHVGPFYLGPHCSISTNLEVINLPTAAPLRLKIVVVSERAGVETFPERLVSAFWFGEKGVRLNPFDKTYFGGFSKPTPIYSQEFIERQ